LFFKLKNYKKLNNYKMLERNDTNGNNKNIDTHSNTIKKESK
jgi:hypothetical protein